METPRALAEQYWFIEDNRAIPIELPVPEFWEQLIGGAPTDDLVTRVAAADGWLITAWEMVDDMASSETHPDGDELHYLVSGRLDLVLEHDDEDEVVSLEPGESAVVPKGVWHRFAVREPARAISMTFGRGTQHRPFPR